MPKHTHTHPHKIHILTQNTHRRTVQDSFTGEQVVLTDEQLDLVEKIQSSQYTVPGFDPYEARGCLYAHTPFVVYVVCRTSVTD